MIDNNPSFFIVGAPKCGTTALAEYLRTHPDLGVSIPKEPHYFGSDIVHHRKVESWSEYLALFKDDVDGARYWGEASTHYLRSEQAITEITAIYPLAKFIVMVREPWESAYSWHQHLRALGQQEMHGFRDAWLAGRRETASLKPGDLRPDTAYLDIVSYGAQLARLQDLVKAEQLLIIDFNEFCTNTEAVFMRVLSFLDVDSLKGTRHFPPVNQRKLSRFESLQRFVAQPPSPLLAAWRLMRRNTLLRETTRFLLLKGRDEIRAKDRALVKKDVAEDWALATRIQEKHSSTKSCG